MSDVEMLSTMERIWAAYAYLAEVPVRSSGVVGVRWRRVGGRIRLGLARVGGGGGYGAWGMERRMG